MTKRQRNLCLKFRRLNVDVEIFRKRLAASFRRRGQTILFGRFTKPKHSLPYRHGRLGHTIPYVLLRRSRFEFGFQ